jgi:hypothetical protein
MATCYYHPDARAKFVCPDCGQDVCDACRLEGSLQRCGHCAANGAPVGGPAPRAVEAGGAALPPDYESIPVEPFPAGTGFEGFPAQAEGAPFQGGGDDFSGGTAGFDAGPEAGVGGFDAPVTGFDDFLAGVAGAEAEAAPATLVMCSYHGDVVAEIQCLNCFQPYCMACLPSGTTCAACKADPGGRAVREEPVSPLVSDLGYEAGMDFAASYIDRGGIHEGLDAYEASEAAAAAARPRKPGGGKKGGGAKKAGGGPKKPVAKPKAAAVDPKLIGMALGGLAVVGLVAGAAWWFIAGGGGAAKKLATFTGKAQVSIVAPKAQKLRGFQEIRLQVATPTAIDRVEVYVGGKKFSVLKQAPFKTDWPTSGRPDGKVEVVAKAFYKNGPTKQDKRTYLLRNR